MVQSTCWASSCKYYEMKVCTYVTYDKQRCFFTKNYFVARSFKVYSILFNSLATTGINDFGNKILPSSI